MSVGSRIRKVREDNKLSMAEFGEALGDIASSSISRWENGNVKVTTRSINLICERFSVNKEWLLSGTGAMHVEKKPHEELGSELGKLLREQGEYTEFKQKMITHLLKLPESHWMVLNDLINSFVDDELTKLENKTTKKSED